DPARSRTDLLWTCRARVFGSGKNDAFCQGKQDLCNGSDVLVAHRAKNKGERAIFIAGRQGGAQCPGAGRVMRYVHDNFWPWFTAGHDLKPSRPACLADTALDGLRRNREPLAPQFLGRSDGQSKVAELVAADQRRFDFDLFSHHEQRVTRDNVPTIPGRKSSLLVASLLGMTID